MTTPADRTWTAPTEQALRECLKTNHRVVLPATACDCGLFVIERTERGWRYFSPRFDKPSRHSAVVSCVFCVP